jgi:hypothetical protein
MHATVTARPSHGLALLAGIAAIAIALAPASIAAQTITGTILDAATNRPVDAAEILLHGEDEAIVARAQSDAAGRFTIHPPAAGAWVLTVRRIGFTTIVSDPLQLQAGDWVTVDVILATDAIALDPIVVTARRSIRSPDVQRFYDRRDLAARSGIGHFIVRDEIERLSPQRPTDLLRGMPGLRVVRGQSGRGEGIRMASGCIPAIYVDGMPLNRMQRTDSVDDFVAVLDLEGIEIYRGATSRVAQYHDPTGCGLILVWTRGGYHDPQQPFKWKLIVGTLASLGLFLIFAN